MGRLKTNLKEKFDYRNYERRYLLKEHDVLIHITAHIRLFLRSDLISCARIRDSPKIRSILTSLTLKARYFQLQSISASSLKTLACH